MTDKTILINSMNDLYALLVQNQDIIYKDPQMCIIKDFLDIAYGGCPCKKRQNESQALEVLNSLNVHGDRNIIQELKNHINTDKIIININNEHLFDL